MQSQVMEEYYWVRLTKGMISQADSQQFNFLRIRKTLTANLLFPQNTSADLENTDTMMFSSAALILTTLFQI